MGWAGPCPVVGACMDVASDYLIIMKSIHLSSPSVEDPGKKGGGGGGSRRGHIPLLPKRV